jgi:hypothetical protein
MASIFTRGNYTNLMSSGEGDRLVLTLNPQEWVNVTPSNDAGKTEPEGVDYGELHEEVAWKKEVLIKFQDFENFYKIFNFSKPFY